MSKRAEEFSIKYADNILAIVDKELSETNYHRHTKMGVHIFDGSDIEQAAMDGYEQAEKDLALTTDDVWCIFNLVRDLQTKYSATEGCLQEVADIFNEQRKK